MNSVVKHRAYILGLKLFHLVGQPLGDFNLFRILPALFHEGLPLLEGLTVVVFFVFFIPAALIEEHGLVPI